MKKFIQLLIFLALSITALNAQQLIGTTNKIVVINLSTVVSPVEFTSGTLSVIDVVKAPSANKLGSSIKSISGELSVTDVFKAPMLDKLGSSSDNYKWEQELDAIIKLRYRKFLAQLAPPYSMAYDALKALKEKEARFGLTREIKDEYIYWYRSIRDDVKANYNIDLSK